MILTLMLYRYLHNLCFSLTFILSHLKLVLILWDTLWCLYRLPDSPVRFSLWITQLLCSPFSANPAKSSFFILPPACSFHTNNVQAEYDIRVLMFWAGDIEGPLCSRHFLSSAFCSSILLCQIWFLHYLWLLYLQIPLLAHFLSQNLNQPSSTSLLLKNFHMLLPRDWQALPSQAFFICVLWTLFFFNNTYCSKSLCRSGGFKCWSLFLSLSLMELLCALQQITLTFALSDLLRWQVFEARTASYSLFLWCQSDFHNSNK